MTEEVGYRAIRELRGPLLVVDDAEGVGWDEFATIHVDRPESEASTDAPEVRHGLVLEVDGSLATVQIMEGADGLSAGGLEVRFANHPLRVSVGPDWLGRVCNGRGEPIDGGPPISGPRSVPVGGWPLNPVHRDPPRDPVITGVSTIDALTTLVRGQKLPIFSAPGLPHLVLATQIAAQARASEGRAFHVVFAAMGLTHADIEFVRNRLEERSAAGELVLLLNAADDPVIERILTPRIALTVAEDLAFTEGHDVLVIMSDMTSYAEAVREVSAARREIPARRGYPGYLYSDLATLYERCGRIRDAPGSVTVIPVLTMPGGDITHPVPDLTGYITEGQIVLTAELEARGVYPPIDVLGSLSRLMRAGAGPGRTREDHLDVAAQVLAALSRSRQAAELSELVGEFALGETDREFIRFRDVAEHTLFGQGSAENRSLEDTLGRAWQALAALPRRELTMVSPDLLDRYLPGGDEQTAAPEVPSAPGAGQEGAS